MIATSFKGNNFILQVPGNANHQVIVGTNGPNRHGLIPVTKLINVKGTIVNYDASVVL